MTYAWQGLSHTTQWDRKMPENYGIYKVSPVLIERHCGGWLAITPRGWPIGIGVTAKTKDDAEKKFEDELARFSKIRNRFD